MSRRTLVVPIRIAGSHISVYPASDGGILSAGEFRSNPGDDYPDGIQTSILLKVDSIGCLDTLDCEPIGVGLLEFGTSDLLGDLRLYPNPTNGVVRVLVPGSSAIARSPTNGLRLEVLDQLGMVIDIFPVSELRTANQELLIDLTNHPAGVYHLRLIADEGVWTGRVLKE